MPDSRRHLIDSRRSSTDIDRHVGMRIRQRRMLIGMSLETMAQRLGLTYQQVQKYEHAINRISAGRLFRISQVLNVPVNYFYAGLGDQVVDPTDRGDDRLAKRGTLELLRAYYGSPHAVRMAVRSILKTTSGVEEAGPDEN